MPGTLRNSPGTRREEYLSAFRFYLGLDDSLVDHIVVLENSGADLAPFRELASQAGSRKKLSLFNCSSEYPPEKGKGYGEFLMMDRGLAALALPAEGKVWKITGRLMVENIGELIRSAPAEYAFYCDMRNVPLVGNSLGGNRWMELRVFSFTGAAYERWLRGTYDLSFVLEQAYFERLMEPFRAGNLDLVPRFRVQPRFLGFSGFSNKSYSSATYRIKGAVRTFGRRWLPGLWL
jgi:hypothetical protein